MNMYDSVRDYSDALTERIAVLKRCIENCPEGNIKTKHSKGHAYFCRRFYKKGRALEEYIPADKVSLAEKLAKKRYARAILPILEKNLNAAQHFLLLHSEKEERDAAAGIGTDIRKLCISMSMAAEDIIGQWNAEEWSERPGSSFDPEMPTECGLLVRSKSEVLICDKLYREGFTFKYEMPLYPGNSSYPVFPDFSILDPMSGNVIYWEHFGRMGDPEYAKKACRKLSMYAGSGIVPGKDLICTFEADGSPLNLNYIDSMIGLLKEMIYGRQK